MTPEMREFIHDLLIELRTFLDPLWRVTDRPRELYGLLAHMGWNLEGLIGADLSALHAALDSVNSDIEALTGAADQNDVAAAFHAAVQDILNQIDDIRQVLTTASVPGITPVSAQALTQDLTEYLILAYLAHRTPAVYQLARLLNLIILERATPLYASGPTPNPPGEPMLRYPVPRMTIHLDDPITLVTDMIGNLLSAFPIGEQMNSGDLLTAVTSHFDDELQMLELITADRQLDKLTFQLDYAGLELAGSGLPLPSSSIGEISLDLPIAYAPVLSITPDAWKLMWQPDTTAQSDDPVVLFEESGFIFTLLGKGAETCEERGVSVSGLDDQLGIQIDGGIGVTLPLEIATGATGDRITGLACCQIKASLDGPPVFELSTFNMEGDFYLGGTNGLHVHDAVLQVEGLTLPLSDDGTFPFKITVSGKITLADSDQFITVAGMYDGEKFTLQSTGQVHLGNGVWLYPQDDNTPILALNAQTDSFIEFAVAGLLKVPHAEGDHGVKSIAVAGDLKLERDVSTGIWSILEFEAAGQVTGDWLLPGDIVVEEMGAAVEYSDDGFAAVVTGQIRLDDSQARFGLDGKLEYRNDDSTNVVLDVALSGERLNILDQAYLFALQSRLHVQTHNQLGALEPSGFVEIQQGTLGLFPESAIGASPTPTQFLLVVQDIHARFDVRTTGFVLLLTDGDLLLPPVFNAEAGGRASAGISDVQDGIRLVYELGASLSFEGSILFQDFVYLPDPGDPSATPIEVRLQNARLVLPTFESGAILKLPYLIDVVGRLEMPLTAEQKLSFALTEGELDLHGLPLGTVSLTEDVRIPLDADDSFVFIIHGAAHNSPTRLVIDRSDSVHVLVVATQTSLEMDAEYVTDTAGDSMRLSGGGEIRLLTGANAVPTFHNMMLEAGGEFHIGGEAGLYIHGGDPAHDASIRASGIENILNPSALAPFEIALTGVVQLPNDGPSGGLNNARFIFDGSDTPLFDLDGISGGTGDLGDLPFKVTELELLFGDGELPAKLQPQNTKLIASVEFKFSGDGGDSDDSATGVSFGVNRLRFELDENGNPQVSADGAYFDVSDLEMATLSLSGGLAIGGLDNPAQNFVAAGKLGGKLNGAGVEALVAFGVLGSGMIGPLGAALEVSGGQAGIPLGPTGFLLTGVKGGVSYTGSNSDPDDLRSYVKIKQENGRTVIDEYTPPPTEETTTVEPYEQDETAPPVEAEDGPETGFVCPSGTCPPRSVGILYEPHPDRVNYPYRVIYKFTALDEQFVNTLLEVANISRNDLAGMTPDSIALELAEALLITVGGLIPSALHDELRSVVSDSFGKMLGAALLAEPDVYQALLKVAYAGIPAVQQKLKLTGAFSYAGVSVALSVTGGFVLDLPNQVVGIIGSLNLLGIPIGKLRAFLALMDENGAPDPSLCGDLTVGIGPLELGHLRMSYRYGLNLESTLNQTVALLQSVSEPVLIEVMALVDQTLLNENGQNPIEAYGQMSLEQRTAVIGVLLEKDFALVGDFLSGLFNLIYDAMNPKMLLCGSAEPKIFGLPLGGELVGISAMVSKEDFAAAFRFSPMGLLSAVMYGILPPCDLMELRFRVSLPDPRPIVEGAIRTAFATDPTLMQPVIDHATDHVLSEGIASLAYEIAPMGFELADAQARLIMPSLQYIEQDGERIISHPANPLRNWERPEDRPGPALPSRLEVALAALRDNDKLKDVTWIGTGQNLRDLADLDNRENIDIAMNLQTDYFPHGGIIGAGALNLPQLFIDAPDPDLYSKLLAGDVSAVPPLLAALTTPVEVGQMAFYVPLPNPPERAFDAAQAPMKLIQYMIENPFDLKKITEGEFYTLSESFFQGKLGTPGEPFTLLGIPAGSASIELAPPDNGKTGHFRIEGRVPSGKPLSLLIGTADLRFTVRQPPSEPIFKHFATILADYDNGVDVTSALATDLAVQLPKVSLVAEVEDLKLPTVLQPVLDVRAAAVELHAYSPLYEYDPDFIDGDAFAAIRNYGGTALTIKDATFRVGPFGGDLKSALITLGPPPGPGKMPMLSADLDVGQVSAPGLELESARLNFSTNPFVAQLSGKVASIDLGLMRIEPLRGQRNLHVSVDSETGTMHIDPARLSVPFLGPGASVQIHGATERDPFTFSTSGEWHATLSIRNFSVQNSFDRRKTLFTLPGTVTATLKGNGLRSAELTVQLLAGGRNAVNLLPDIQVGGYANGSLIIRSEGSFTYAAEHSLTLPGFEASGILAVGLLPARGNRPARAYARLTDARLQLPGLPRAQAKLAISTTRLLADLDFGSEYLGVPNLFEMRAGLWKLDYPYARGVMTLAAEKALAARLLGKEVASLDSLAMSIDSNRGAVDFKAETDGWVTLLPNLLELRPDTLAFQLRRGDNHLSLDGRLRALKKSDNNWHVDQRIALKIGDGPFEQILLKRNDLTFLPSSGLIYRRTGRTYYSRLILMRDGGGTLSLALHHVGINFNGERRLSATINSQGVATFEWDMDITSSGLTYEPDKPFRASLGLNLLNPSASLVIPRGRLKAAFEGWPANGYVFPRQDITLSTNQPAIRRTYGRNAKSWQSVPGFPFAEYRLTMPQIKVAMNGATFVATLSGGIRVRTTARRPDNQPWADVNATFSGTINSQGIVPLQMPAWGNLGDPLQANRNNCRKKAKDNNKLPDKPPAIFDGIKPPKPNYRRPSGYDPFWHAYDVAYASYIAAKRAWEGLWKAYNDAVAALNAALDQCNDNYPQPPQLDPLGVINVGLDDILT